MTQNTTTKNKLICTVTGKTVSVAPKVFDARAIKFGSDTTLRENYISAYGRKLLCSGKLLTDLRTEFNVPAEIPLPSSEIIAKYTRWAKYRNSAIKNEKTKTQIESN